MRKVAFKKQHGDPKINQGLFHQWGLELYQSTNGDSANCTVGIVEDEIGKIHKVDPVLIAFIDKPKV